MMGRPESTKSQSRVVLIAFLMLTAICGYFAISAHTLSPAKIGFIIAAYSIAIVLHLAPYLLRWVTAQNVKWYAYFYWPALYSAVNVGVIIVSPEVLFLLLLVNLASTAIVAANSRFAPTVVFGMSVVSASVLTKMFSERGITRDELDAVVVSISLLLLLGVLAQSIYSAKKALKQEKQKSEEAQRHAEAEREKSEKMHKRLSTIGQMASTIVHDLKNPMGIIKGYVEMADAEDTSKEEREGYHRIIDEEIDRLSDMAFEILDFASGDLNLNIQNHSLKEYMGEIYQFLKPHFDENSIELRLQLDYDGALAFDADRVRRVILNLATNAKDAMVADGEFLISTRKNGSHVLFDFTDTGPGIPREIQDTLFEVFVSKGKEKGTGLGMATVKNIVEAHGGEISFETTPGEGTTFTVSLPAEPGSSRA